MEDTTVLPKELRLGVPPKMPQARSYLFRQQSTLADYQPEKTIQINIPRLQRSYLRKDSCLRFRVTGEWTPQVATYQNLVLDSAGAYGFIDRIEVFDYLGSTVLESISGIPQLSALLLDMGMKDINHNRNGSSSLGLISDYVQGLINTAPLVAATSLTANATVNTTLAMTPNGYICPANTGAPLVPPSTSVATKYFSREFAIPLPSFLGFLSDKMIPLVNGFTIVITLSSLATPVLIEQLTTPIIGITAATGAAVAGTGISGVAVGGPPTNTYETNANVKWSISDVYLNCQILELGLIADSMMANMSQGRPLVVHTKSFRNYVATTTGQTASTEGQAEFVLNMNLNVASLTNILWIMRPQSQLNKYYQQSYGHRIRNFLQRWHFQYGSTTLPQSNGIQAMGSYLPSKFTSTDAYDRFSAYSEAGKECFEELLKSRPNYKPHSRMWDYNYEIDQPFAVNVSNTSNALVALPQFNKLNIFPGSNSFYPTGRFACGLNLQLVNGKDGQIISGLNTNGMNTSIRGIFHPLYTNMTVNSQVDAWAEYDAFINISPGVATTVSF